MTETLPQTEVATSQRRGLLPILKSYFYWTYPRGCFHYDVMVTLILIFLFATPHLWNYGDKPTVITHPFHPIQVIGDDGRGLILTVAASDVDLPLRTTASDRDVKKALRKAIEPVTGNAVFVEHWETLTDTQGNAAWKVWAHR